MNLNIKPINILPIPTWRWLKLNETSINVEELGNYEVIEPRILGGNSDGVEIKKSRPLDFPTIETGMGAAVQEFVIGHAVNGIHITIPENLQLEEALVLHFDLPDNGFVVEDIYLHVKTNAKVKIVSIYTSKYDSKGFHGGSIKVLAEDESEVEVTQLQLLGKDYYTFNDVGILANSKGKVSVKQLELGAKKNWLGICVSAPEKQCEVDILNLYLAGKDQSIDLNYLVRILGEKNKVEINSKGLLLENANKLFRGTLDFQRGCKGSIGTESEDVILMDENIVNKSIPVILCGEDDIQGDHAAAIREMDSEERFYLQTRGLSEEQIRQMVIDSKIALIENELPSTLQHFVDEYKKVAYANE